MTMFLLRAMINAACETMALPTYWLSFENSITNDIWYGAELQPLAFSFCCHSCRGIRLVTQWRVIFKFWLSRQLQDRLAAFKTIGSTRSGGKLICYLIWVDISTGSREFWDTWIGSPRLASFVGATAGDAQRQAIHFKLRLPPVNIDYCISEIRISGIERGLQDQSIEHRVRHDLVIIETTDFGKEQGLLVGMGMTARVRVTTTSASTGISQLGILTRVMLQVLQVRGGLLRLCLLHLFVLPVESLIQVKDCPQAKQKQSMPADFARLPPPTGRVYATTRDQAAKTSGTITGILYIDDRTAFVLFDTGATHSIISTTFAKKLNMNPTPLIERVIISTPMKNHMLIDHEYVNCPLRFDDRIRPANYSFLPLCSTLM
ncbi:reverse transcriptase domain-containing protein [Tanacetum coccineum]